MSRLSVLQKLRAEAVFPAGMPNDSIVRNCPSGLSLFAKTSYAPGEVIFEEKPFAFVRGTGENAHLDLTTNVVAKDPQMVDFLVTLFGEHVAHLTEDPLTNVVAALNVRTMHPRGVTGLFPTLNFVDHCCEHTCDLVTPENAPDLMRVVARTPIAAGDPLTISYIGLFGDGVPLDLAAVLPKRERQMLLKEQYGFTCACPVCNN